MAKGKTTNRETGPLTRTSSVASRASGGFTEGSDGVRNSQTRKTFREHATSASTVSNHCTRVRS
eukprot:6658884-Lingulodinium_polyedra.AAC.1